MASKKPAALKRTTRGGTGRRAAPAGQAPSNGKAAASARVQPTSIGQYLIDRLYGLGIRHVFGVPGDYVLHFYKMLEESKLRIVTTTREDGAGFAADAYARMHGLGAICVTYCVGGLNVCNAVAGAYAEKSPVVVISGAPGIAERANNPMLHHRVGSFSTQKDVFDKITVASTVLEDRLTAFRDIDRVLGEAVRRKGPVYIELPRDRVDTLPLYEHEPMFVRPSSDREALDEAIAEVAGMLAAARKPLILAGVEIHRFGLQRELTELAEKTHIPIASTLLGKSVIAENHPLFVGVYEGRMCRDELRQYVEASDCILMLGCFLTDIDTGGDTNRLADDRCIYARSEEIRIRHHEYQNVLLADFLRGLVKRDLPKSTREILGPPPRAAQPSPRGNNPVTVRRLFQRINDILDETMVVIADVGDCLFAAADLVIHRHTEFISPAYYTSMGFAVPGALGASFARPDLRPIVVVGDGAFQMTGTELSTIARYDLKPIVIVLDNGWYGTEHAIQAGSFNNLHPWRYARIVELLGKGWGTEVSTEQQLDQALQTALANRSGFSLLDVHLDKNDRSPALERLARRLAKRLS